MAHIFNWLLRSHSLREAWGRVRNTECRIRLRIDCDAPELHVVPWEAL